MLKNPFYKYGDQNGRVPAHCHFGKEVYDNMVRNKDVIALINAETDERMTYGEFAQMTANIALSLTHIGVKKGDVICVCSERRFEFFPSVLGIICAGATFSPTDLTYDSIPLLHRLKIARPKLIFCSVTAFDNHKELFKEAGINQFILYGDEKREGTTLYNEFAIQTTDLDNFEPVPVDGWTDLLFVLFSSGTTGLPKGVPVTHLAFLLNAQCITKKEYKGMCIFNSREWSYTYGLMYSLGCMRDLITMIYHSKSEEKYMLGAIEKYKVQLLLLAPMLITGLIKSTILEKYDVSSVHYIVSSSTYIREDEVNAVKKRLPNLHSVLQVYGMSEAGSVCNETIAPKGSKPGSSGVPCFGFVIKVVDLDTRQPLGPNQRGEICIKGPSVLKKYVNNLNPYCKDEEGFLKTGDVGYYDEDGYFFIVNRIKELIKFNDLSIAPAEFEAILLLHPAVHEACVVGKPDPKHGEIPIAFVALQPGLTATEEELVSHVNSRDSFRMRLLEVRFVDRLPRSLGDKLDRNELKRWLLN